ncbi:DUF4332 domain-containing protein [Stieleria sp. JC731]|uniref:DUF4332 domain-containing protein n=1 Tax=Pirellulaceae TaxID=2691357 RepID=UPI001E42ABD3|nr:DUF4332 domain-containing protein [Stieleria sp. JC731]MCC9602542.1 DUF4332 domain-containing protein [Stieleria sp. JC731]
MLLDRIDIDTHGPLNRVELGPFSEGLNVVCTPEGSGKTALVRFIRDSLVRREYPLGMMSSSSGRVVWADRNGKIHCRREHDGTANGRRTIEFETRGETAHRFDWLHGSWVNGIADSNDASRALEAMRIPDSIVDGIATDTAVTSVSRVIAACLTAGLNDPSLFAQLPHNTSAVSGLSPAENRDAEAARRAIRDELARIEAELATLPTQDTTESYDASSSHFASKQARRESLQARLEYLNSLPRHANFDGLGAYTDNYGYSAHSRKTRDELNSLHHRIWQLRVRHGELVRWLDHLQADRNRLRYSSPITSSPYSNAAMSPSLPNHLATTRVEIDSRLRERLVEVDGQIIRWRRIQAELNSLREIVFADRHRQALHHFATRAGSLPLSDTLLQRERMGYVASSLDYFAGHPGVAPSQLKSWAEIATAQSYAWPDEIDLHVEALIRKVDSLQQYYGRAGQAVWSWYGELAGQQGLDLPFAWTRHQDSSLLGHLRALREDLAASRRYGFGFARHYAEANAAPVAVRRERELMDLQATEKWIIASIERLLVYRTQLIRDHRQLDLVRYPSWLDDRYHNQSWSPWYVDHLQQEISARTVELQQTAEELDRCVSRATDLRLSLNRSSQFSANYYLNDQANWAVDTEIQSIVSELNQLNQQPVVFAVSPRVQWLQRRRAELLEKLGAPQSNYRSAVPLADEASAWLVRLSGGRLRRVDWNPAEFTTGNANDGRAHLDGQDEASCPAVDRALAALAVRLAAGDLLARTGRAIPLVVEAHRELLHSVEQVAGTQPVPQADAIYNVASEVNLAVIAALNDYAKSARQLIVLTSDAMLADQVSRRGGRVFQIQGERVAHEHRPVWRPHYTEETYVGPHAGMHVGAHVSGQTPDPLMQSDAMIDRYYDEYFQGMPVAQSFADINRNLDAIWQEAYGIAGYPAVAPASYPVQAGQVGGNQWHSGSVGNPAAVAPNMPSSSYMYAAPPQQAPVPGANHGGQNHGIPSHSGSIPNAAFASHLSGNGNHWNDGYYYCDTYTTSPVSRPAASRQQSEPAARTRSNERPPASPFFLTVDSPIDQAPSVDAVAAARLRALNVTHITHLMNQDPNRMADALGLASVTAATIRRWQSECRLVCNVPQLRGFDARVLVGCGITDPGHLAATDPSDLLDRVEAFLATERGQRILLSGTSYELSRITSWIAAAGVQPAVDQVNGHDSHRQTIDGRVVRQGQKRQGINQHANHNVLSQDRYEYQFTDDHGRVVRASSGRARTGQSRTSQSSSSETRTGRSSGYSANGNARHQLNGDGQGNERSGRSGLRSGSRRSRRDRDLSRNRVSQSERSSRSLSSRDSESSESQRAERPARSLKTRSASSKRSGRPYETRSSESSSRQYREHSADDGELKFYLQRSSPIVDAPSIGARMAERLEAVGICDVNDLLEADPEGLADELGHRRIDADVIRIWQSQSILVCRIPMLRGHDAQLLVAADVTTAEEVAAFDPDELFELILPIAKSNEGKRIIRGGKLPDLEEINEWIANAKQNRDLVAA